MSTFKHHRNNKERYNIYESHIEVVEPSNFYVPVRNTLFIIALTVSILVTSLIYFDTYQNKKDRNSKILLINQVQQNQVKDEITQVISNRIIQKIDSEHSLKDINQHQLKLIIKHVMEKVKNSPNQIIYTQK